MKKRVMLSVRGRQAYEGGEPDTIELVTEGMMERTDEGWLISYEESALTGMDGVTTSFYVQSDCVILERTGKLQSRMVFREGQQHDSLYKLDFGALMISVCPVRIWAQIDEFGGVVDLVYNISIEQGAAGEIDYHLLIQPIK